MTQARISDPSLLPDLLASLARQISVVAEAISDDEIEISVLGSYRPDAMRIEASLRLRAWEAAQRAQGRNVRVEIR